MRGVRQDKWTRDIGANITSHHITSSTNTNKHKEHKGTCNDETRDIWANITSHHITSQHYTKHRRNTKGHKGTYKDKTSGLIQGTFGQTSHHITSQNKTRQKEHKGTDKRKKDKINYER